MGIRSYRGRVRINESCYADDILKDRVSDTGACMEYLLKHGERGNSHCKMLLCSTDVLGTLVRLSEADRPFGIQAEVLRAVQNMVVLLDEQFLVHSAVHRAVLRLLRNCVGDDMHEQLWHDGRDKVMGAARNSTRGQPSEYEEDCEPILPLCVSRAYARISG